VIEQIVAEYARLRDSGMERQAALAAVRPYVEGLTKAQREELSALIRAWETRPHSDRPSAIKRIGQIKPPQPAPEAPQPTATVEWINCPSCGKANRRQEVFCYACGGVLEPMQGAHDTKHFSDTDAPSSEYFGPDSVLALRVRGSAEFYEVRPQDSDHETVIGRSVSGSPIAPDVDLNSRQAADLGVSRLHLSLRYDFEQQVLLAIDMGSANGSFINGQRLLAKEVRVLRHGDELRLGRLVLNVSFRHPK
jgi:hypothetical protein